MPECRPCPPGSSSQSEEEAASCELCEAGFFQASPGSSNCQECPPDSFTTKAGSTSCEMCPHGSSNYIQNWLMYTHGRRDYETVFNSSSDCLCKEVR